MNARGSLRVAGGVLLLVGALTACGDDGRAAPPGGDDGPAAEGDDGGRGYGLGGAGEETPEGPRAGEETTGTPRPGVDGNGTVALGETDLGRVLVDPAGMTLYVFTEDSPGTSSCADACLDLWPPVPGVVSPGDGVREDLLGTLERSDGEIQASYAERPLYTFAQDAEPGDVTGHGFGGTWFVVGADGDPLEAQQ